MVCASDLATHVTLVQECVSARAGLGSWPGGSSRRAWSSFLTEVDSCSASGGHIHPHHQALGGGGSCRRLSSVNVWEIILHLVSLFSVFL